MSQQLEQQPRPETVVGEEYRFCVLRPGGNNTCLVAGIVENPYIKALINDEVMRQSPTIEQVGFVSLDPNNIQLVMAGGEFCGNATRSTAWLALSGVPGEITIQVSGVSRRLKAGVTQAGEAFAQMPIFTDPSKVAEDPQILGNYSVAIEGISHYVDFRPLDPTLSPEELKQQSLDLLAEKGLMSSTLAAGVMYSRLTEKGWDITPVVYVPNAGDEGTLFIETACGSGTTALGLVLALRAKQSIENVPIIQPTGLPIYVTVRSNAGSFEYAEISGPMEVVTPMGKVQIQQEEDL